VELDDLKAFLNLSGEINYQLDARIGSHENVLATIVGDRRVGRDEHDTLVATLEYLERAYEEKYRRLGPKAILHPLRAAALLVRAGGGDDLVDLLAELLHDKFEDIVPADFTPAAWEALEARFTGVLERVDATSRWYLMERLDLLTRRKDQETYYAYIGRLLDRAPSTPAVVKLKLADRLDNTLDVRVDSRDPLDDVGFFESLFRILYSRRWQGFRNTSPHPPAAPLHGARRLYEQFKNTVVLSLVRERGVLAGDPTATRLFTAIARAGMKEAQRILIHIFAYHYPDPAEQRRLLLETMEYCISGGLETVTPGSPTNRLDGLFLDRFDSTSSEVRQQRLEELYRDKELMSAAAVAFVVIFLNFLTDDEYLVRGVSASGIEVPDAFR
jgi:hypothetical protein